MIQRASSSEPCFITDKPPIVMGERESCYLPKLPPMPTAVVVRCAFLLWAWCAPAVIAAQAEPAPATNGAATASGAAGAKPSFLSPTRKLATHEAKTKVEGTYVNGLPIIDVDPDSGIGFGAVGNVFWDGPRADPFFSYTPYRHRIGAQGFVTTNGLQQHFVDYDGLYLGDTPYRLRANIMYERNTSANYFGRGANTLRNLSFTGAERSYTSTAEYTEALRQIGPDNVAHTLYNKFDLEDPSIRASIERVFLKGLIRLQLGFAVSYVHVRDFSGRSTRGDDLANAREDVRATQAPTRLHEDCQAGGLVGCNGGLHNAIKLGLALDTRDYEPDPNSGVFVDLTSELSSTVIASDFDYARVTFAARGFWSPFPALADVVLAGRFVYSAQTRGTPFFAMNTLAFTDVDRQGLGGLWTLRGYRQDRFVGPVAALLNLELRWTFIAFDLWDQHLALAVVPFLDLGRVFDRIADFSLERWRLGSGGALHIAWNDATIINITAGASREGLQVYMDLGQQF